MNLQTCEITKKKCDYRMAIDAGFVERTRALLPYICKRTGCHQLSIVAGVHHLLDFALRTYERRATGATDEE